MANVLEVLTFLGSGGAEMVVYNYLSHMDRVGLNFEIAVIENPQKVFLDSKFRDLGIKIHYLPKNPIKRLFSFWKLISVNEYDIIHSHCEFLSEIYLAMAALKKVKVRIMHSHIASPTLPIAKRLYQPIGHFIAKRSSTHFFGCGIDACKSLWGTDSYNAGRCYVMNNAVDTQSFEFDSAKRDTIRQSMGWGGKHIIMNVGRFTEQKNHKFIIEVFAKVVSRKPNAHLVLIGEGELYQEMVQMVNDLGIAVNVEFLGRRGDVSDLLNAADVFFLPSLYEGLPVVAIECQANGLPLVMSDTITKECGIIESTTYLFFNAPTEMWVDALTHNSNKDRKASAAIMKSKGYNISIEAGKLRDFYISSSKK